MRIDKWIVDDLAKSGLTTDDIKIIPLTCENQSKNMLGRTHFDGKSLLEIGGYFIPYPNHTDFYRFKIKTPIDKTKYISKYGSVNYLYIPNEIYKSVYEYKPDSPIFISEGEKKSSCATKFGFPTIGMAGVYGFLDRDGEIEDFKSLNLSSRTVYIVFDNDINTKTQVKQAELRLAVHIVNKGGSPLSIRLPKSQDKIGFDDFLVNHGKEKFTELVISAKDTFTTHINDRTNSEIILKELSKIKKPIIKAQYIKQLATDLKIPVKDVNQHLKELEQRKEEVGSSNNSEESIDNFTDEEIEKANELLRDKNLFDRIITHIENNGYVGEANNKKVLYLAFTSRLLDEAISCVVKGDSSSGKSSLVKAVLCLFPESVYKEFTSISPQALYYMKDLDLSHKVLIIFEANGSEKADYPIRSSISEGELRLLVTQKNQSTGKFESNEIVIPAKGLSYVETTTRSKLNPENQTRLFDLYTDCSEEQTRKILKSKSKIIDKDKIASENRIFKAMQLLLEPFEVLIPYSEFLADCFPTNKVRTRRDFTRFINLIKAVCLLHQYQRDRTMKYGKEYIIATVTDYEIAYDIANVVLSQTLKEITPRQELILNTIKNIFPDSEFSISDLKELDELKNIPDSTLRADVKKLSEAYLEWNGEKAKKSRFKLIDVPKDGLSLPTPEELESIYPSLIAQYTNNKNSQGLHIKIEL